MDLYRFINLIAKILKRKRDDMAIYIFLYLAIVTSGIFIYKYVDKKYASVIYAFFCILSIGLVQALRDTNVAEDTATYVQWFHALGELGWRESFNVGATNIDYLNSEPGYKILNYVVYFITKNSNGIIIATAFIIITLHTIYLKFNSKNLWVSMILYFGIGMFQTSMTPLRQFIAMGFIFWVIPLLDKRKYVAVAICTLLAISFHQSSLIYFALAVIFWFIAKKFKLVKYIFIVEVISIPLIPYFIKFFVAIFPRYEYYFINNNPLGLGKLRTLFILLDIFIIVLYYIKKDIHNRFNTTMICLVSVAAYVGISGIYLPRVYRIGYYFDYAILLIIPELIPYEDKRKCRIAEGVIIACSSLLFMYYLYTNAGGTLPYELFKY